MESRETQRFTLELDPIEQSIAGSLTDERGTAVPFTGWLGLARALERALNASAEPNQDRQEGLR